MECKNEDNRITYTYQCVEKQDTIFVAPPVLFFSKTIQPISCSINDEAGCLYAEEEWIKIDDVTIESLTDDGCCLKVHFEAFQDVLPRFPELSFDNLLEDYVVVTSAEFDEHNIFTGGEFYFYIYGIDAVELERIIKDSEMRIPEVLEKGAIFPDNETAIELEVENRQ